MSIPFDLTAMLQPQAPPTSGVDDGLNNLYTLLQAISEGKRMADEQGAGVQALNLPPQEQVPGELLTPVPTASGTPQLEAIPAATGEPLQVQPLESGVAPGVMSPSTAAAAGPAPPTDVPAPAPEAPAAPEAQALTPELIAKLQAEMDAEPSLGAWLGLAGLANSNPRLAEAILSDYANRRRGAQYGLSQIALQEAGVKRQDEAMTRREDTLLKSTARAELGRLKKGLPGAEEQLRRARELAGKKEPLTPDERDELAGLITELQVAQEEAATSDARRKDILGVATSGEFRLRVAAGMSPEDAAKIELEARGVKPDSDEWKEFYPTLVSAGQAITKVSEAERAQKAEQAAATIAARRESINRSRVQTEAARVRTQKDREALAKNGPLDKWTPAQIAAEESKAWDDVSLARKAREAAEEDLASAQSLGGYEENEIVQKQNAVNAARAAELEAMDRYSTYKTIMDRIREGAAGGPTQPKPIAQVIGPTLQATQVQFFQEAQMDPEKKQSLMDLGPEGIIDAISNGKNINNDRALTNRFLTIFGQQLAKATGVSDFAQLEKLQDDYYRELGGGVNINLPQAAAGGQ